MEDALTAFAALSQGTRLDTLRLLIRHEPEGLPAGDIARRLEVPQNTLSAHLSVLARGGLVVAERQGRSIVYRATLPRLRETVLFLLNDCCEGRPDLCGPLPANLVPCCPTPDHPEDTDMSAAPDIVIYHNPDCGTSRNTLALIRNSGIEPHVVEYLKTPPSRARLADLIARMGVPVRAVLREKGTPYDELGLGDPALSDDQLLDAMMAHPILINRPIVVSPLGVKLCRPSEAVLDLLPNAQRGAFAKEDGTLVVDDQGNRRI